jgi:hypothetical protein
LVERREIDYDRQNNRFERRFNIAFGWGRMNSHIADRAGFLAALAKDDPERVEAEQHAHTCAPCREAFAEGLGLVALLDESQPLSPPSPDLLARAASAIEQQSAGEASVNRRVVWGAVTGVLIAWAFQLTVGSGFSPDMDHAAASLMVLGVALAGVTLLRNQPKLTIVLVAATSLAMVFISGTSSGLAPGVGIRCSFRELWAAGLTWIIAGAVARRVEAPLGRWKLTAIVGCGALAALAGQHLACEVPHAHGHLLVFHFGAVLLAIAGALGTKIVTGRRATLIATR